MKTTNDKLELLKVRDGVYEYVSNTYIIIFAAPDKTINQKTENYLRGEGVPERDIKKIKEWRVKVR